MTVSEIKSRFLLLLDAAYSQAAPGFEDYQISEFLDKAQKDFVDQVAKAKIYDDIYQIIEVAEATITPSSYDNRMYHFEIDNYFPDFGYYVSSRVRITRENPQTYNGFIHCELINSELSHKFLTTAFNKPYFKFPKVYMVTPKNQDSKLHLITDAYSSVYKVTNNYEITYIRIPRKVDITAGYGFQINNNVYEKLIEMAVTYAVNSLKTAKITTQ